MVQYLLRIFTELSNNTCSYYGLIEKIFFCLFYLISYLCLNKEPELVIPKILIWSAAVKKENDLNTILT